MSSIFSKIIAKEIPAQIVYEDEYILAFLDINPVKQGHTLVVPKEEALNALESSVDVLMYIWSVIKKIAPAIELAVGADGCNIMTNIGESSGQVVMHTHFHIIPRTKDDGLKLWHGENTSQEQLSQVAEKIRTSIV